MSPEQFAGEHARIGPPTDVWALGVVLHELGWECRPGFAADRTVALPADDGSSAIRTGLRPIVARCLAWEPGDRYPTAAELRADLEALLAPLPAPPAEEPRPTRRLILAAAGTGLLGLGAAGATWWAFTRRKDRGEPESPPDPLDEIRKELADTGSVDLLRPDGTWRWSEWVAGEGEWTGGLPDELAGGRLGPATKGIRLLEVVRDLPGHGFRLSVDLQHVGPAGEIGVYVGRSVQATDRGPHHCLIGVKLRDWKVSPEKDGTPRVERTVGARNCPAQFPKSFWDAPTVRQGYLPRVGDRTRVEVELTVPRLVVRLDGQEFARRDRTQMLAGAQGLAFKRAGFEGVTPIFHPSEGVGLFVWEAEAVVRAARLERIDPPAGK